MGNGGIKGLKFGAFGLLAVLGLLVGPGVATVSAKPAVHITVLKKAALPPIAPMVAAPADEAVETAPVVTPVVVKRRLRRLMQQDLNGDLILASAQLIKKHHAKRFGSQVDVEIAGKPYVARIERHFHPEGGAIKPWGYHPGVSLFAVE